eukprot:7009668-Alexandrium_andersonii.AAC.1
MKFASQTGAGTNEGTRRNPPELSGAPAVRDLKRNSLKELSGALLNLAARQAEQVHARADTCVCARAGTRSAPCAGAALHARCAQARPAL